MFVVVCQSVCPSQLDAELPTAQEICWASTAIRALLVLLCFTAGIVQQFNDHVWVVDEFYGDSEALGNQNKFDIWSWQAVPCGC